MKRKLVTVLTALALCLTLLPGTAWAAEGDPVVTISSVTLESGKKYVAGGMYGVEEKPGDIPEAMSLSWEKLDFTEMWSPAFCNFFGSIIFLVGLQ